MAIPASSVQNAFIYKAPLVNNHLIETHWGVWYKKGDIKNP